MKLAVTILTFLVCCTGAIADPAASPVSPPPTPQIPIVGNAPVADLSGGIGPISPNQVLYSPDVTSAYVLGPGDSIAISVTPQDRYSLGSVSIPQDGTFMYPRIGTIFASGKTVGELKTEIEGKLSQFCVNPDVLVVVTALRPEPVYVTIGAGALHIFDVRAASTVAKAITLAGGAPDINQLQHVTIFRGTQTLHANVYKVLIDGIDDGDNIALEPNDLVVIPMNTAKIEVLGAVSNPGIYALNLSSANEGVMHLSDALSEAGGTTREGARVHEVRLVRESAAGTPVVFKYDYGRFMEFGDMTENPVLQDKDMIVVPDSKHTPQLTDTFTYFGLYNIFRGL
jgi:protein involved in polysaccharide export with SLBB domain